MKIQNLVSRRWWMLLWVLVTALSIAGFGCESDDEDDEEDTANEDDDAADDDVTDDDDATDDDDDATGNVESIVIEPSSEAIPLGTDADFVATVTYKDTTTETNPADLVWETGDDTKATVDAGTVTGVAGGSTTLSATMEGVTAMIDLFVGPDVFLYDMFTGTVDAIDRGSDTYIQDYLATKASVATVPNHIFYYDANLYVTDSADGGPGKTGNEKVVVVDPAAKTTSDVMVDMDSPWAASVYDGYLYVTGNLSDDLAKIDLATKAIDYISLPAGCVPGQLTGANGKVYISCTGFDSSYFTYGNTVAVYDPSVKSVSEITLIYSENPGSIVTTADESAVYVIAVGNYYDTFGAINKIDTATDTIESGVDIGGWLGNAVISDADMLFVLDDKNMYAYDTATDSFVRNAGNPITVGSDGSWLAGLTFNPDSSEIYVSNWLAYSNSIEVIDAVTFTSLGSYDLSAIGVSPGLLAAW